MPFVETNGIRLHYLDHHPEAGGLPLLLMHGLTANAHAFDGLIQAGLANQRRVITPDLRGRGLSDKPDASYSLAEHAADIDGLLDALGLEQVLLGGHSYGGLLTMFMAGNDSRRFPRLLLIDASIATANPRTVELIKPSLDRLGRTVPSLAQYLELIRAAPYLDRVWNAALESYFRADVVELPDGSVRPRAHPEQIAAAVEGTLTPDWPALLQAIMVPVLLINATGPYGPAAAPPVVSAEHAQATATALHNCRYVHVDGNHVTMLFAEGAAQIVTQIDTFLEV